MSEARLETVRQMGATLAVNAGAEEGRRAGLPAAGLIWCSMPAAQARRARRLSISAAPAAWWCCWAWAQQRSEIDFSASIRKEHRVAMSFAYTPADFESALKLLSDGEIDLSPWTAEMPLEEGQQAFEQMITAPGATLRMMLRVS